MEWVTKAKEAMAACRSVECPIQKSRQRGTRSSTSLARSDLMIQIYATACTAISEVTFSFQGNSMHYAANHELHPDPDVKATSRAHIEEMHLPELRLRKTAPGLKLPLKSHLVVISVGC